MDKEKQTSITVLTTAGNPIAKSLEVEKMLRDTSGRLLENKRYINEFDINYDETSDSYKIRHTGKEKAISNIESVEKILISAKNIIESI